MIISVIAAGLIVMVSTLNYRENAEISPLPQGSTPTNAERQRVKAPDFSLRDSEGRSIRLSDLKGKVVAVNFWATWCGPCRDEIPGFLDVYQSLKSNGLEIIGVSLDSDGWGVVKPFVKRYNISYPVVMGNAEIVSRFGGFSAIPATFIIDREGYIRHGRLGYFPEDEFANEVGKVID